MLRASCGSPCEFDRAFVAPDSGDTKCVWTAPTLDEMKALFTKAQVEVRSITPVEEMTSPPEG